MKVAIFLLFAVAAVMSLPANAESDEKYSTTATSTTTEAVEKCPKQNGEYVTVIPNPADCTTYFACETGVPILMKCPAGLHFNPRLHVCDSPVNAKCTPHA